MALIEGGILFKDKEHIAPVPGKRHAYYLGQVSATLFVRVAGSADAVDADVAAAPFRDDVLKGVEAVCDMETTGLTVELLDQEDLVTVRVAGKVLDLIRAAAGVVAAGAEGALCGAVVDREGWLCLDRPSGMVLPEADVDPTAVEGMWLSVRDSTRITEEFLALRAVPNLVLEQHRYVSLGRVMQDALETTFLVLPSLGGGGGGIGGARFFHELQTRLADIMQTARVRLDTPWVALEADSATALFGEGCGAAEGCTLMAVPKECSEGSQYFRKATAHLLNGRLGYITQHRCVLLPHEMYYDTATRRVVSLFERETLADVRTRATSYATPDEVAADLHMVHAAWGALRTMLSASTSVSLSDDKMQDTAETSAAPAWTLWQCVAEILSAQRFPQAYTVVQRAPPPPQTRAVENTTTTTATTTTPTTTPTTMPIDATGTPETEVLDEQPGEKRKRPEIERLPGESKTKARKRIRLEQMRLAATGDDFAEPRSAIYIEDDALRETLRTLLRKHSHNAEMSACYGCNPLHATAHNQKQRLMRILIHLETLLLSLRAHPDIETVNGKVAIREVLVKTHIKDLRELGTVHSVTRMYQGNVLIASAANPWEKRHTSFMDVFKSVQTYLAVYPYAGMVEKEKKNTGQQLTVQNVHLAISDFMPAFMAMYRFGVDELYEGRVDRPAESPNTQFNPDMVKYLAERAAAEEQQKIEEAERAKRAEEVPPPRDIRERSREDPLHRDAQRELREARDRLAQAQAHNERKPRERERDPRERERDLRDRERDSRDLREREHRDRDRDRDTSRERRDRDRDRDRERDAARSGRSGEARPAGPFMDEKAVEWYADMMEVDLRDGIKRAAIEKLTKAAFSRLQQAPEILAAWERRVQRAATAKVSLSCWYLLDALLKEASVEENPFLQMAETRITSWARHLPVVHDRAQYTATQRLISTWEGMFDDQILKAVDRLARR